MKICPKTNRTCELTGCPENGCALEAFPSSPCSAPIVPLGTVLPCGTVAGVQFLQGERYYFTTGGGVGYLPADVVEKQYSEQNK